MAVCSNSFFELIVPMCIVFSGLTSSPIHPVYSAHGCLWEGYLDRMPGSIEKYSNWMKSHTSITAKVEDCQSKCEKDYDCDSISYNQKNGQCVLLNATINRFVSSRALQINESGIYLIKLNDTCSK